MKIIHIALLAIFLASCTPAAPSPASVTTPSASPMIAPTEPVATKTASPTATKTRMPSKTPTITPIPSPTEVLVEDLLDWQPVPNQGIGIRSLAFDGEWLVVEDLMSIEGNRNRLYARKMDAEFQEIFVFQELKGVLMNEWGSGIELAAGRVAFVVSPYQGDTTHGYEVWLADLERGEKVQVKASENALPAITMNERWLAIKDSTSEMSDTGEQCIEVYDLPGLTRAQTFCTEDRISWPELSGDWLTYKRYARGENCPSIESFSLASGETRALGPDACPVGFRLYTSESLIAWWEDGQMVIWSKTSEEKFRLQTERLQLCGDRVYYTANAQEGMELRSWQPDGTKRVLQSYRGTLQFAPADDPRPFYDVWDIHCGGGWVMFQTNSAGLFIAKDGD